MIGLGTHGQKSAPGTWPTMDLRPLIRSRPCKGRLLESSATPGTTVKGVNTLAKWIQQLETPEKSWMLVPAGKPVDDVIKSLLPLVFPPGDIIIDGGNSHLIRIPFDV